MHIKPWIDHSDGHIDRRSGFRSLMNRFPSRHLRHHTTSTVQYITIQATDVTHLVSQSSRMETNALSADIYHRIVDTIQEYAIFMLDTDGLVQTWNKGAQNMFQYQAKEIEVH